MRDSHCHWSCPIEVFLSISPAPSAAPTSVRESGVATSHYCPVGGSELH